jgi:hypothetical protein
MLKKPGLSFFPKGPPTAFSEPVKSKKGGEEPSQGFSLLLMQSSRTFDEPF